MDTWSTADFSAVAFSDEAAAVIFNPGAGDILTVDAEAWRALAAQLMSQEHVQQTPEGLDETGRSLHDALIRLGIL